MGRIFSNGRTQKQKDFIEVTNMPNLIYVTEDDENIRELIKMVLTNSSYNVAVYESAEEVLQACEEKIPDLFIFDIMLPAMNGIDAVKLLRKNSKTKAVPVLMLTAKDTEFDKVVGLDAGADDYITKPFGVMELSARARALLRRNVVLEKITCGAISVNEATREVYKNNRIVELTFKEFELLQLLMKNNDRVLTREELLNAIWGYDYTGETRTLDAHIKSLRQKIGDDAEKQEYIKTVRSVGYRFCEGELL